MFVAAWLAAAPLRADEVPGLATVYVEASAADAAGLAESASEGFVGARQLATRPLLRPAEVLEAVPGLIVSQHSGDGKANQYYLRGFNLDHGTDFATWVAGMPMNMPTHAHGQGYTDLNFLIPELVASVHYRKGPYRAEDGDFASAGSARIDYVRQFPQGFAQLETGANRYGRLLGASSQPVADNGPQLLGAVEAVYNDGPWSVHENLRKLNGVLRLSSGSAANGWSATLMAYASRWTATDQVPRRAVEQGIVGRFGSLDPRSGGRTRRESLSVEWASLDAAGRSRGSVYLIDYALDLFSNFTYALDNPARGDQFEQVDRRQVVGGSLSRTWFADWAGRPVELTLGSQLRHDHIGQVGLFLTEARQRLAQVRSDKVEQTSLGAYGELALQWAERLRTVAGVRVDHSRVDVAGNATVVDVANSGRAGATLAMPRLAVVLGPWADTEIYASHGHGFHSNDARGATIRLSPDPRSADYSHPVDAVRPLVRTRGAELGVRSALLPGWTSSVALWRLDIASELLFVGDAGITEPSRPSRRQGIEWANALALCPGLSVDVDLAVSSARFRDAEGAGARVPGAVATVGSIGVAADPGGHWFGGLRLRYFGPRPLNEDNSVRSASSTLTNLKAGYRLDRKMTLFVDVLNLFNRRVSDIDYHYESQLKTESAPTSDIHFHPAEPRTLRVGVKVAL